MFSYALRASWFNDLVVKYKDLPGTFYVRQRAEDRKRVIEEEHPDWVVFIIEEQIV